MNKQSLMRPDQVLGSVVLLLSVLMVGANFYLYNINRLSNRLEASLVEQSDRAMQEIYSKRHAVEPTEKTTNE